MRGSGGACTCRAARAGWDPRRRRRHPRGPRVAATGSFGLGRFAGRGASAVTVGGASGAGRGLRRLPGLPRLAAPGLPLAPPALALDRGRVVPPELVGGRLRFLTRRAQVAVGVDGPLPLVRHYLLPLPHQVRLEQVRGRERVAVGARALAGAPLRHPGGEALVICLDRHVDQLAQLRGELLAQLGLLALLSREGGGQTHDHPLGTLGGDQLGDRLRIRRLDGSERAHKRPARVRDRTAAPGRAVVEREHPQEAIG